MLKTQMPWPAVDYKKINKLPAPIDALSLTSLGNKKLEESIGHKPGGIPNLILVDPFFKVLASSYVNGQYVGPQNVLNKTTDLLNQP
ncbi:MAG TPA: hypothetical protein PLV25_01150, partial [Opitutales bacterium]|nr:hypothetical protein [Opitutales bacterium]